MNGLFFGKFLPLHRGHITSILKAYTMCDKLYVCLSIREDDAKLYHDAYGRYIDPKIRIKWLKQELQNMENIKVVTVNESTLPPYPDGFADWASLVKLSVGEPIDIIFTGEPDYIPGLNKYFPGSKCELIDPSRSQWNVSGTVIRQNPIKYWDYIVGSARPFFAIKILVTGTESCGKTTLVKMLAKIYHTSWSEEIGRFYAANYLGGDEQIFTDEDFLRIAHLQYENDFQALRSANKTCFIDTDAVVTNYYSELYLGKTNPKVATYIDPSRYDIIFLMKPDVEWVDDGQRLNPVKRIELHHRLEYLYSQYGFKNIIEIGGSYSERLQTAMKHVNGILEKY
jgi:HTH-type transcriptional repressor of NAD biosynthesis genes